jgi:tRNA threonylcarbamoyladenosine biosynthesis protein TsaB
VKILGIDTCTETIDVALVENGKTLSSRRGAAPRQQLTRLTPFIDEILEECSTKLSEINLIAITKGPGSFTGIRLGIATAKTLAQVNNIPLAGVNTLDALAAGCPIPMDGIIIPSMDARKNEVFFAVYKKYGLRINLLADYRKASIEEYFSFLNSPSPFKEMAGEGSNQKESPVILGSVLWRYGDKIRETAGKNFEFPSEEFYTPRGEIVAALGQDIAQAGKTTDYLRLEADYMRTFTPAASRKP